MLTLSSISQRIEQLEEEEYSSTNAQLETWRNMVAWQFWLASLPDRDNWRKAFNELPLNHPVRELAGKLTWLEVQLSSLLTAKRDGFWSERVLLALDAVIDAVMESGLTQEEMFTIEAMNEAIEAVNILLDDTNAWAGFYENKRKEREFWELQQAYRRMANFGELSEEAIEWLKTYDSAFLENFNAKKQSEVKPVVKPVASETIKNLESKQLFTLSEAIPPQEIIQPVTDGPVTVKYLGGWRGFNITTVDGIRAIEPGDTVTVPPFVWANIQSGVMPKSWWIKL